MYHCMHGLQAPRYLDDHITPAFEVASCLHLHYTQQHQLVIPCCRLNTYDRRLPVQRSGTLHLMKTLHCM